MKLSQKGLHTILCTELVHDLAKLELTQNDFVDGVVLTVEEAKEIIGTYIGTHYEVVKKHGSSELKWILNLLDRIEQAEKENGSH